MILLSELSRRRIRSINKLIRVGRNECVVVLRVDKEKVRLRRGGRRGKQGWGWWARLSILPLWLQGYIDLSKRRITPEEKEKCEEKYNKARAVSFLFFLSFFLSLLSLSSLKQQQQQQQNRSTPSSATWPTSRNM